MAIQGIDRVRRNLRVAVENIAGGVSERAVYEVLSQGAAMAQTMTPIDTSTLVNSQTAPQITVGSNGVEGSVGYTAAYAAAVHEAPGTLAGQPRDENDPSRGDYWIRMRSLSFSRKVLTRSFQQSRPSSAGPTAYDPLRRLPGLAGFDPGRGLPVQPRMWVDHPSLDSAFIAAIQQTGGPPTQVDIRRLRFKVILLGPKGIRKHVVDVGNSIETLAQVALGDSVPCGAASVRAIGEPIGPGYTTENRPGTAWTLKFSINQEARHGLQEAQISGPRRRARVLHRVRRCAAGGE
ncbi:hypothetical protein [Pseudomonas aeruginosa]|uniref:hypothetical protein n=1 Tax=Pseudomonas aeruginosa TaxID=287 RepID=UPI0018E05A89|nr:hypothetical protein [Pseudomonas aeruginosa]QPZ57968.1 hypothetical protein I9X26_24015 [Pseudomonas aeruginosa]